MSSYPLDLLRCSGFRHLYFAVAVSELGDAFHYIALMWLALTLGGPIGVIVVRLADSVPAIIFGLHGGLVADRWNRRSTMIRADLARAVILVPMAITGLLGHLRLWELIAAAFILQTATSSSNPLTAHCCLLWSNRARFKLPTEYSVRPATR